MPVISPKCPNCGAPFSSDDGYCKYCQAMVSFTPDMQEVRLIGFPCPKCKAPNDKGVRFCVKCGAPLQIKCSSCRHDVSIDAAICPHCRASRVVKSLIAEADEKKRKIDSEMQNSLNSVEQQFVGHEQFKKVAARLVAEAKQIRAEATDLTPQKTKFSGYAIIMFVLCVIGPIGSLVFHAPCIIAFVLLVVFMILGFLFKHMSGDIEKEFVGMQRKATEMESPEGWKKYANPQESAFIQELFKWREEQRKSLDDQKKAKYCEIETWLEESTDDLK